MSLTSSIFDFDAYPCFNNMHKRVQGLGLAFHPEEREIYYLSAAGPQMAVRSIFSTLCRKTPKRDRKDGTTNNSQIFVSHWTHYTLFGTEAGQFKSLYTDIPNANYKQLLALSTVPNLILCTDPAALLIDPDSDDSQAKINELLTPHKQRIIDQFVGYLNAETEVPVLPKWGPTLWKHAMAEKHITKLQTHGDCVGAWRINKPSETDWTEFVQNLLQQKVISILDIQEVKPIHETRIINQNGLLSDAHPNAQPRLLPAPAAD